MADHIYMECKKSAGGWRLSSFGNEGEEGEEMPMPLPEPETPNESMEFLSRSWSLSAEEISKALAKRPSNNSFVLENHPSDHPPSHAAERSTSLTHSKRISGIGKWFHLHHHHHHKEHHKESEHGSLTKKKDRERAEKAHVHAFVSVASLSAALAAVCAAEGLSGSKMGRAVASSAELLASRCIEMAEQEGAPHLLLTSSIASAVSVATPDHLITLTAAAATALRAEATLSSRLPKDAKRNATISPCDRSFTGVHSVVPSMSAAEDTSPPSSYVGDLMLHTTNGLHLKRISVYINKTSQVKIKLKSKHVGGAFSKKHKWVVYGVSDEIETSEVEKRNTYFGVQTGHGLLEFKCTNKAQKQHWVDTIGKLLCQGIQR